MCGPQDAGTMCAAAHSWRCTPGQHRLLQLATCCCTREPLMPPAHGRRPAGRQHAHRGRRTAAAGPLRQPPADWAAACCASHIPAHLLAPQRYWAQRRCTLRCPALLQLERALAVPCMRAPQTRTRQAVLTGAGASALLRTRAAHIGCQASGSSLCAPLAEDLCVPCIAAPVQCLNALLKSAEWYAPGSFPELENLDISSNSQLTGRCAPSAALRTLGSLQWLSVQGLVMASPNGSDCEAAPPTVPHGQAHAGQTLAQPCML